jgi:hypothetical protein
MAIDIAAYADWEGLPAPFRLGLLHARRGPGREVLDFEFDAAALAHPALVNLALDPRLGPFEGRQHPPQGNETFGVFADASPDRWGRLLMRRRFEREQSREEAAYRCTRAATPSLRFSPRGLNDHAGTAVAIGSAADRFTRSSARVAPLNDGPNGRAPQKMCPASR